MTADETAAEGIDRDEAFARVSDAARPILAILLHDKSPILTNRRALNCAEEIAANSAPPVSQGGGEAAVKLLAEAVCEVCHYDFGEDDGDNGGQTCGYGHCKASRKLVAVVTTLPAEETK